MRKAVWNFFTLAVYIRIMVQSLQHLLLSSISEIYRADTNEDNLLASYFAAVAVLVFCGVFIVVAISSFGFRLTDPNSKKSRAVNEFFLGLKVNKSAGIYPLVLMMRRIIFITWLICFNWLTPQVVVMGMVGLQSL